MSLEDNHVLRTDDGSELQESVGTAADKAAHDE